ncbi:hypothetical protein L208DRAFT_892618 [Tricholoma matsutake]|nr:hypothetical protein L208DRAFT_892618 [Tricholoma matsutake 945]
MTALCRLSRRVHSSHVTGQTNMFWTCFHVTTSSSIEYTVYQAAFEPSQARPKPGLSGQAGPEQHYTPCEPSNRNTALAAANHCWLIYGVLPACRQNSAKINSALLPWSVYPIFPFRHLVIRVRMPIRPPHDLKYGEEFVPAPPVLSDVSLSRNVRI